MLDQMSESQKKAFYETARREAMLQSQNDPRDTQALTRWGGALLELANFEPGEQASRMAEEAATKFKSALKLDPRKHEALWCLGNAYTTLGFLSADKSQASGLFTQAKVRAKPSRQWHSAAYRVAQRAHACPLLAHTTRCARRTASRTPSGSSRRMRSTKRGSR